MFSIFEKNLSVLIYLISSYKLESVISKISTFKCESPLEEIDMSKFTGQASDPGPIRTSVCRPLIQSRACYNINFFLKCPLYIITTVKIDPMKEICLWTRNICNYNSPLLSYYSGHEIYEIHWERGCTLEYCNTLSALKN